MSPWVSLLDTEQIRVRPKSMFLYLLQQCSEIHSLLCSIQTKSISWDREVPSNRHGTQPKFQKKLVGQMLHQKHLPILLTYQSWSMTPKKKENSWPRDL